MGSKRVGLVAWECFLDLGITVVYATIAGLLIVGVVATDDGPTSLVASALYASLLPVSVILLICFDIIFRIIAERRVLRRRAARVSVQAPRVTLRLSRS